MQGMTPLVDRPQYKRGRETELSLLKSIRLFGWEAADVSSGKKTDLCVVYPMLFNIEVKDETAFAGSGNLCIETFQGRSRQRSGLLISAATFWVHVLGAVSAVYVGPEMREHIRDLPERMFGRADNGNGGVIIARAPLRGFPWYDECPRGYVVGSIDALITKLGLREKLEDRADDYSRHRRGR